MIISASRRTDIPAFFSQWFMERIRAGYCLVTNPFNPRQVPRVSLAPEDVDAIVFWTRNAAPLLPHLRELDVRGYRYYFQYTLTGYPRVLEPHAPAREAAVQTMRQLSSMVGPARVVWRYDPILVSSRTTFDYHLHNFKDLTRSLSGLVERVVISLADRYAKAARNLAPLARDGLVVDWEPQTSPGFPDFVRKMAAMAASAGMEMTSCAEEIDLLPLGVKPGACIDGDIVTRVLGVHVGNTKDKSQRKACRCVVSRDIGSYNTCGHGCTYCYATTNHGHARKLLKKSTHGS